MRVLALLLLAARAFGAEVGAERVARLPERLSLGAPTSSISAGPQLNVAPPLAAANDARVAAAVQPVVALAPAVSVVPSAPALAAAPARGPPSAAFVAGREHEPQPGAFERVRRGVLETVRDWTLPVEKLLEDKDVLLLGESHQSLSSLQLVTRELPRLKKAGVTAVGLEGLKGHHQEAVDHWLAHPDAEFPHEAAGYSVRRREQVHELFRAAKEHGIRLVALGSPLQMWARRVAELAAARVADPDETAPRDLGEQLRAAQRTYKPGYNESLSEVVLTQRNAEMADRLADALQPGQKAVAVVGDAHVEHPDALSYRLFWLPLEDYGNLAFELGRRALRAASVTLTGGLFVDPAEDLADHKRVQKNAYRLVAEASPEGKAAYLPTSPSTGVYHLGGRP